MFKHLMTWLRQDKQIKIPVPLLGSLIIETRSGEHYLSLGPHAKSKLYP